LQGIRISSYKFSDDGAIPNNPHWPLTVYSAAFAPGSAGLAELFERRFQSNGWGSCWRNGIFQFPHYHSTTHEVLGIAGGHARVRFGGTKGIMLNVSRGDAVLIPAGVGHERIAMSSDLLVVGAYPAGFSPDVLGPNTPDYQTVLARIHSIPRPHLDPVQGITGPALTLWD